jgi:hypothetical protein
VNAGTYDEEVKRRIGQSRKVASHACERVVSGSLVRCGFSRTDTVTEG